MSDSKVEQSEASGQSAVAGQGGGLRFLTREELAEVLQISIRTVDAMVAAEEIPCVRLRGAIVRFYLPDVVRHLTATALTRKRGKKAESRNAEILKWNHG
jgi:excisionase family DNA binding protein